MLLTYSKDQFVDLINAGIKIHTIRPDYPRRWRAGMKIHQWRGNPRNVSKNPYPFGETVCTRVQDIQIFRVGKGYDSIAPDQLLVCVTENSTITNEDWHWLQPYQIRDLAGNDGLTVDQFRMWFVPPGLEKFTGRIIHWTDRTY